MISKSKKLVYVSEDLINEAIEAARRDGKSLGAFVEESLKLALSARRTGYNPKEASDLLKVIRVNRTLGGAYIPMDILNHLFKAAYKNKPKKIGEKWYESGMLHGKYLKEKFEDPIQAFKTFLEVARWDLNEVEVQKDGDTIKFRCFSTILTEEGTDMLLKYVEGVFHGIGYKTIRNDHMKGMIILEFKH